MYRINKRLNSINRGSDHAIVETFKSGTESKIESEPKIASVFDLMYLVNRFPAVKMIRPYV